MSWKQNERTIAKRLQGQRVGNVGKATPDVVSDWLSVECKERKRLPDWLWQAVLQAVATCDDDKLPVVILHEKGRHHDNDLVLLRLQDFQNWFGPTVRCSDTCEGEITDPVAL